MTCRYNMIQLHITFGCKVVKSPAPGWLLWAWLDPVFRVLVIRREPELGLAMSCIDQTRCHTNWNSVYMNKYTCQNKCDTGCRHGSIHIYRMIISYLLYTCIYNIACMCVYIYSDLIVSNHNRDLIPQIFKHWRVCRALQDEPRKLASPPGGDKSSKIDQFASEMLNFFSRLCNTCHGDPPLPQPAPHCPGYRPCQEWTPDASKPSNIGSSPTKNCGCP